MGYCGLTRAIYWRTVSVIQDYDFLVEEADAVFYGAHKLDGGGKSSRPSNPTENKALKRAGLLVKIDAIDAALMKIPAMYRKYVFNNVRYNDRFPVLDAKKIVKVKEYRDLFICNVAKNLGFLE